ncbi:hypothetical protein FRC20_011957 [Serendipita sp. 405]|nr:hypothetical protein FRC15_005479 [Serendipita sp. 397]KAG8776625.1 hypothetical protein FRC16_004435 [Serendipita sp. 398]KAG8858823.1 hypothetical protein FRC20_011957 [Serendipita sp. 405]
MPSERGNLGGEMLKLPRVTTLLYSAGERASENPNFRYYGDFLKDQGKLSTTAPHYRIKSWTGRVGDYYAGHICMVVRDSTVRDSRSRTGEFNLDIRGREKEEG